MGDTEEACFLLLLRLLNPYMLQCVCVCVCKLSVIQLLLFHTFVANILT